MEKLSRLLLRKQSLWKKTWSKIHGKFLIGKIKFYSWKERKIVMTWQIGSVGESSYSKFIQNLFYWWPESFFIQWSQIKKPFFRSDGSGSNIFDPGRVGSGRVSHLWFGFEFGKFPLKKSNFSSFCPSGQKKSLRVGSESTRVGGRPASYLLRVKSKHGSGQGPSLIFWS